MKTKWEFLQREGLFEPRLDAKCILIAFHVEKWCENLTESDGPAGAWGV